MSARDEQRSARLLFAPELAAGTLAPADLERRDVTEITMTQRVPAAISRTYQRVQVRRGRLTYRSHIAEPWVAIRQAVLGDAAAGPPRLLVRVDELPHYKGWDPAGERGLDAFRRFHEILAEAGMPYLLAVTPRVSRQPLDPSDEEDRPLSDAEVQLLVDLRRDNLAFGLHGLDHRTRHRHPRRHGELLGLSDEELATRLDRAHAELAEAAAIRPRVLVPPFNRFAHRHWKLLASRYDVVCGGPENVRLFGWHRTPQWRGEAVWMPAYPPLYGNAAGALEAARTLDEMHAALWVPVVLHWGWEADDGFAGLRRFAKEAARWAAPWDDFLAAVALSAGEAAAEPSSPAGS